MKSRSGLFAWLQVKCLVFLSKYWFNVAMFGVTWTNDIESLWFFYDLMHLWTSVRFLAAGTGWKCKVAPGLMQVFHDSATAVVDVVLVLRSVPLGPINGLIGVLTRFRLPLVGQCCYWHWLAYCSRHVTVVYQRKLIMPFPWGTRSQRNKKK